MDAGKWIVESAYCDHMTRMQDTFLTIDTILVQFVQDGEGTVYAVIGVGRVWFQLELGEFFEVNEVMFVPGIRVSRI